MNDAAPLVEATPAEPAYASVAELARWLREEKTTPTRLAEYFLDRLRRLGPRFNAVVTVTADRAIEEARRAERELAGGLDRGLLHGIPYGAKDLLAARGYPTTWGAGPLRDQTFDRDATVVRKLTEAGAVLVAKLAMVELAGGMGYVQADASFTGPGLNPWDTSKWSGGSSSGPGSAVAAGLVPFAIASETWGSIVTPAAFCGVTGLRPSFGRVSRSGAMALSWSLDKLGPMCRSARDAGSILAAIAGPDPLDPTTFGEPFAGMAEPAGRRYRIAVFKEADRRLQQGVGENYRASLEVLRRFADVTEVELPAMPFGQAAHVILAAETAGALEEIIGTDTARALTAPEDQIGGLAGRFVLATDYLRALRLRERAVRVLTDWLAPFDALACPALAVVANPIAVRFDAHFSQFRAPRIGGAGNLAGLPALALPNGFANHLPTGLQLVGAPRTESVLLRVGHELQEATGWHRRRPLA